MGIFNEACAQLNAEHLERIIKESKKTKNADVILFAQQHIYPYYCSEQGDAFKTVKKFEEI